MYDPAFCEIQIDRFRSGSNSDDSCEIVVTILSLNVLLCQLFEYLWSGVYRARFSDHADALGLAVGGILREKLAIEIFEALS